ncbi:hypothetical protein LIER_30608 [Lithospermum erythrorhizon]|uniref:Uncharacterized protein n=1 Tax=Lithospermum erythrorhizon TaxID=34254 RepID=A0AAV3RRK7_LITER
MNLELLAKQGWRIMTQQAPLLFKVLKGRYFRRTSFLNAKLGTKTSFGWCSLLEGRKVLLKGTRWRVGDGKSIDMWKEPWVPISTDFHLRGSRGDKPHWVSQLIRSAEWDKGRVEEVVEGEDVKNVLFIPLSRRGIKDRLIWNHTRCGNYLTCSEYKCAQTMKRNGELRAKGIGEGSRHEAGNRGWKDVWQLRAPPRVK